VVAEVWWRKVARAVTPGGPCMQ